MRSCLAAFCDTLSEKQSMPELRYPVDSTRQARPRPRRLGFWFASFRRHKERKAPQVSISVDGVP